MKDRENRKTSHIGGWKSFLSENNFVLWLCLLIPISMSFIIIMVSLPEPLSEVSSKESVISRSQDSIDEKKAPQAVVPLKEMVSEVLKKVDVVALSDNINTEPLIEVSDEVTSMAEPPELPITTLAINKDRNLASQASSKKIKEARQDFWEQLKEKIDKPSDSNAEQSDSEDEAKKEDKDKEKHTQYILSINLLANDAPAKGVPLYWLADDQYPQLGGTWPAGQLVGNSDIFGRASITLGAEDVGVLLLEGSEGPEVVFRGFIGR